MKCFTTSLGGKSGKHVKCMSLCVCVCVSVCPPVGSSVSLRAFPISGPNLPSTHGLTTVFEIVSMTALEVVAAIDDLCS